MITPADLPRRSDPARNPETAEVRRVEETATEFAYRIHDLNDKHADSIDDYLRAKQKAKDAIDQATIDSGQTTNALVVDPKTLERKKTRRERE